MVMLLFERVGLLTNQVKFYPELLYENANIVFFYLYVIDIPTYFYRCT